jgi:hypothetical protein
MTDEPSGAPANSFDRSIDTCIDQISALLPDLAQRYSIPEIVTAFSEHVGGGFLAFRRGNIFNDEQTIAMIEKIERAAFRKL